MANLRNVISLGCNLESTLVACVFTQAFAKSLRATSTTCKCGSQEIDNILPEYEGIRKWRKLATVKNQHMKAQQDSFPILKLPAELVGLIITQVDEGDILQLLHTNRYLCYAVSEVFLRMQQVLQTDCIGRTMIALTGDVNPAVIHLLEHISTRSRCYRVLVSLGCIREYYEGLSMFLSRAFGVQELAITHHFKNKDDDTFLAEPCVIGSIAVILVSLPPSCTCVGFDSTGAPQVTSVTVSPLPCLPQILYEKIKDNIAARLQNLHISTHIFSNKSMINLLSILLSGPSLNFLSIRGSSGKDIEPVLLCGSMSNLRTLLITCDEPFTFGSRSMSLLSQLQ
ncbi:hypothetical protein BDQ17DRAFT_1430684 [Cyathus striatus]|nr:hypothetical protein BDQ17DRAFT_1430684 [Cyathus striatus]